MKRHVFMFQSRFVSKVLDGSKVSTIRFRRKREVQVGDIIDLRTWSGVPYRSKQTKLRESQCVSVESILISTEIIVGLRYLHGSEIIELAQTEGFDDTTDMLRWFYTHHELPFLGTLYRWTP